MSGAQYQGYLDYFIADYADEIAANYGLPGAEALDQARREVEDGLPQGLATPGQVLLSIIDPATDEVIGYIWYKHSTEARSVFIYDFSILPAHRGKGLGKRALVLLEDELGRQGIRQMKLRVAGDNLRAKHVYDVSGFRVTGFNMSKIIEPR